MKNKNIKRKLESQLIVFALISAVILGAFIFTTPTANASTAPTIYYWNGYDGNDVVYLAKGVNYILPTMYSNEVQSSNNYGIKNVLNLTTGQTSMSNSLTLSEEYTSPENYMTIYIPIAVAGGSDIFYDGSFFTTTEQNISVSLSGGYPASDQNNGIEFQTRYNSGINASGYSNDKGTSLSTNLAKLGLDAAGFLPYAGYVVGAYQTMMDLESLTGIQNTQNIGITGTGVANEIFGINGGTIPFGLYVTGQNIFASQAYVLVTIDHQYFANSGLITIGAKNIVTNNGLYSPINGASAEITIPIQPAALIQGTIFGHLSNGDTYPLADTPIYIQSKSENIAYQVVTNSTGNFQFYGLANTWYTINSSDPNMYLVPKGENTTYKTGGWSTETNVKVTMDVSSVQSCVSGNTPILMADGYYKLARNIKIGDKIDTYNFTTNSTQIGTVLNISRSIDPSSVVINGYLTIAPEQKILTERGWVDAQNLTLNDSLYDAIDGIWIPVMSIYQQNGNIPMYDYSVSVNGNYIAYVYVMYDRIIC